MNAARQLVQLPSAHVDAPMGLIHVAQLHITLCDVRHYEFGGMFPAEAEFVDEHLLYVHINCL